MKKYIVTSLLKNFYWPICRFYARNFEDDKPAGQIMHQLCRLQFMIQNGYCPNFDNPRSFTEKLWSRQLHDRDIRLTIISDKLAVRDYIQEKIGIEYLPPLLWKGNNPEDIPFDELPNKFVIKTNHGCGFNIIVANKEEINYKKVKNQLKKWLKVNFCKDTYLGIAWGYKNIKPSILIESFLEINGKSSADYKFWCFGGKIEIVTVHIDRFGDHRVITLDRNFKPHRIKFPLDYGSTEILDPPNYQDMIQITETIAEEFDFIRVDLYNLNGQIYFSELTAYPGGVSISFKPKTLDFFLGNKWQINFKNNSISSNPSKIKK